MQQKFNEWIETVIVGIEDTEQKRNAIISALLNCAENNLHTNGALYRRTAIMSPLCDKATARLFMHDEIGATRHEIRDAYHAIVGGV